jgi:hypothetical protein
MTMLRPFVFGHGPWIEAYRARLPDMDDAAAAVVIDVLDTSSAPFFKLMLAANARAFGDMGMPAWVQLDCATLPTAMLGFARLKADLDPALVADLEARAGVVVDDDALIPVAEYTALCTPQEGLVLGFSLFSLEPGLGLRAKAMALLAMGARQQEGVTQIDNSALKTHARFGPLSVVRVGVAVHSRPQTTLVYRLAVPDDHTLMSLARGTMTRVPFAGATDKKTRADVVAGDVVVDVVASVDGKDIVIAA